MIAIAILASGKGSNFQSIIDAISEGGCDAKIKVLISDRPYAKAIERAEKNRIPVELVLRKNFDTREQMDSHIYGILESYGVELVVLAGYMRIIKGKNLLKGYENRMINIHPALLPSFPGMNAQKQAFEYGAKVSGATVHFVDSNLDAGPIIMQEAVDISDCKDSEEVASRIIKIEHRIYPKVVDMFSKGRFRFNGRRAIYVRD